MLSSRRGSGGLGYRLDSDYLDGYRHAWEVTEIVGKNEYNEWLKEHIPKAADIKAAKRKSVEKRIK